MLDHHAQLLKSFRTCFHGLDRAPPLILFDELIALHSAPDRHYHNTHHLAHCHAEFASAPPPHDTTVALALWFHDSIYDPRRSDNEDRSALLAVTRLEALNFPPDTITAVVRLIHITSHHAPPVAPDEQHIVDIDLAILGQPDELFDRYEQSIRLEFAHVPDDAFRIGRAAVLQKFLSRPTIYHTPHFRAIYEESARGNLARSFNLLTSMHSA